MCKLMYIRCVNFCLVSNLVTVLSMLHWATFITNNSHISSVVRDVHLDTIIYSPHSTVNGRDKYPY